MTESNPPVTRFFELQRETIRETGAFLERVVEASPDGGDGLSVEQQQEFAAETVELARESAHRSLDTVQTVTQGGPADIEEARESVDSAFDTLLAQQTEAFETIEERSGAFESGATARIDEQVDLLLEVTDELEQQLTELAEQFVAQAEEGQLGGNIQEQLDDITEQLGEQAGQFTDLEERFETIDVSGPDGE
jgi:septation ring formation regulator EzrA